MSEQLPDDTFSYDDDLHEYRNASGLVRPSVTQTLKDGGIFNYSRVPAALLNLKREIGKNVHRWTARHDESGRAEDDLLDLYPEERPYAESYMRLLDEYGPMISWIEIEKAMLADVSGFEMGGTPDRFLRFGQRLMTWDLKCVAAFHPGWRLQLADYNMMRSKRSTCAQYGRAIVRLMKDGRKAKLDIIDPKYDAVDSATAAALVTSWVWRRNHNLI